MVRHFEYLYDINNMAKPWPVYMGLTEVHLIHIYLLYTLNHDLENDYHHNETRSLFGEMFKLYHVLFNFKAALVVHMAL